jgi:hypothetical protein
MNNFYLVNGEVKFLTHNVEWQEIRKQRNEEGKLIDVAENRESEFYDIEKKDAFIEILRKRGIEPVVTEYEQPTQEIINRVAGKKFNTIEEARTFIEGNNIEILKAELAETDYKIIKSYEYQLVGLPLPYDIEALHSERQAIRDRINQLEGEA